jgi:hypothetical protein
MINTYMCDSKDGPRILKICKKKQKKISFVYHSLNMRQSWTTITTGCNRHNLSLLFRQVSIYLDVCNTYNHPSVCHSFPYFFSFARQLCVRVSNAHLRAYVYGSFLSNEARFLFFFFCKWPNYHFLMQRKWITIEREKAFGLGDNSYKECLRSIALDLWGRSWMTAAHIRSLVD